MLNGKPQRAVAVIGDANDINCWSNIPYFFLQAGKHLNFFQAGLKLHPEQQKFQRLLWNLAAPLRGERTGGFQFSRSANEDLFERAGMEGIGEIVSHFQLFPPHDLCRKKAITFSHYLDLPLPSLFEDYGVGKRIGRRTAQRALACERDQYAAARFVVCMSSWAARQVVERCGVPAQKVHVIIPGANLPESAMPVHETESLELGAAPDGKRIPLRIAFVGKDALRKGLDRLVEGARSLRRRGYRTIVRVIGPHENLFPHDAEVEHVGFINKLHEPLRLLRELQSCHMGALPSYQEAFGIAALEYLRCGLPSLITSVGGLGDSIPPECGVILSADCTGEDIADALENLLKNPEQLQRLREQARLKASYASWNRTIQDFIHLWEGSHRVPVAA